jgi:hypothetical protein
MYVIGASYLEGVSLDLTGGTEISSVLNLILWFHDTLIHSIVLLPTNKHLTLSSYAFLELNYYFKYIILDITNIY